MIALPARLFVYAVGTLTLAAPLAAQEQARDFVLPPPTPTPTPAPAGPVDERGGVAFPPRAAPAPRISPAPVLTAEPSPSPSPLTQPSASPRTAPSTEPSATATPAPGPATSTPSPIPAPLTPGTTDAATPAVLPLPTSDAPIVDLGEPQSPVLQSVLPSWWPWAAGALGGLALLIGGVTLWWRRKPKVLHLAPPPSGGAAQNTALDDLPPLDITVDIVAATRSVMMFTLAFRINLANRSVRAVNDLSIAAQLVSARSGASNAASQGAAQQALSLARIGPHQSRSVSGEIQLPLSQIAIMRQGSAALFIPLMHVTLEGEGQAVQTRSFVVGTPSISGAGRLHPIRLDNPPGSILGLRAQTVDVPAS